MGWVVKETSSVGHAMIGYLLLLYCVTYTIIWFVYDLTHLHLLTLDLGSLLAHCVWYRKFRGRLGEMGNLVGRQSPSYDTVLKHVTTLFKYI